MATFVAVEKLPLVDDPRPWASHSQATELIRSLYGDMHGVVRGADVKSLELVKRFWNEQVSVVRIFRRSGPDMFVNAIAVAGKRYHFAWRVRGVEPLSPMLCKLAEATGHEVIPD